MLPNLLYVNYPKWIHPEVFPGVPFLGMIRWYGLMYVAAFLTAGLILRKLYKLGDLNEQNRKTTEDDLWGFMACGIVFLLIGARLFSTLFYDPSYKYLKAPWLIFWPFEKSVHTGKWVFTGLAGMSYHGGLFGGILGLIIWCLIKKRPMLKWIDAMTFAVPLAYTFGRLGNFMNGELFGRITTAPWGMVFPDAEKFSTSLPWVKDFCSKINMPIAEGQQLVNLPRHPSQLYEAFFEGIVTFGIMLLARKKKPFHGFIISIYTFCYGLFRFCIEYFRQPDADQGFMNSASTDIYRLDSLSQISKGQIFCIIMMAVAIIAGVGFYFLDRYNKKKAAEGKDNSDYLNSKQNSMSTVSNFLFGIGIFTGCVGFIMPAGLPYRGAAAAFVLAGTIFGYFGTKKSCNQKGAPAPKLLTAALILGLAATALLGLSCISASKAILLSTGLFMAVASVTLEVVSCLQIQRLPKVSKSKK